MGEYKYYESESQFRHETIKTIFIYSYIYTKYIEDCHSLHSLLTAVPCTVTKPPIWRKGNQESKFMNFEAKLNAKIQPKLNTKK